MKRKILALFLSVTCIWCTAFHAVAADELNTDAVNEADDTGKITENNAEEENVNETSGKCGDNLSWVLDEEGTLTISGTGEMDSWSGDASDESENSCAPWNQDDVRRIVIEEGVTSIGDYAFYMCSDCEEVQLADSIAKIGDWSFAYCGDLNEIVFPKNLDSIGEATFKSCNSLTELVIPDGTTSIGYGAFRMCEYLECVTISDSVVYLGDSAFAFCGELKKVKWSAGLDTIAAETFYQSKQLTEIEIPEGVTTLEEDALINTGLTSITIPKSVTYMGEHSVGYKVENDEDGNSIEVSVEGFKIYGYSGSVAETYADESEFEFISLDEAETLLMIVPEKTDSTYVQGSGKDLVIYCTGEFNKFVSAEMDGELIDPSNYTVEEGSTVLTLAASYLDTLSVGKHVVTLNYIDGSISTDITILKAESTNSGKNENPSQTNNKGETGQNKAVDGVVKTGDNSNEMIWLILCMASVILGLIYGVKVRKKSA